MVHATGQFRQSVMRNELKQPPVSWELTIDASMQGQPLAVGDFLSRAEVVELMDDVIVYVGEHVAK